MNIEPLSKKIYDKAVSLGISRIELKFSGGNDEGYLYVYLDRTDNEFEQEIEGWARQAYGYSGDIARLLVSGDDVVYDLLNKTATASSWYMQRTEGGSEEAALEIAE